MQAETATVAAATTAEPLEPIPTPAPLAPVSSAQRIDVMDMLRGFALIGILMMNIEWFNRPIADLGGFDYSLSGSDFAVGWFIRVFIEGKFYKLFSLLFGMGFAVMLLRAQEAERPFASMFVRRMTVLFLFGMLHLVFFWGGDILHDYAAGGLLLLGVVLLLRKPRFAKHNQPTFFLKTGLTVCLLPFVVMTVVGTFYGMTHDFSRLQHDWSEQQAVAAKVATMPAPETVAAQAEPEADDKANDEAEEKPDLDAMGPDERIAHRAEQRHKRDVEQAKAVAEERAAFTQPSFWQATVFRAKESLSHLQVTPFFSLLMLLPLFMIGYWLVASGAMRDPARHRVLFKSLAWVGMGLGIAMNLAAIELIAHPASKVSGLLNGIGHGLFQLGQFVLAAGYLGLVVCLSLSDRWRPRLAVLAPLGRMALTNYLTHSLILTLVFYGYGARWFGHIGRAPQMLLVIAIVVFQWWFSRWWLQRFRFGPMEWLWRSATYKQWQPLRNAA